MTIPHQQGYTPSPGGWPPPGDSYQQQQPYQQYQGYGQYDQYGYYQPYQTPTPQKPNRRGKIGAAVGGGIAALVLAGVGGFAAGWTAHGNSVSSTSAASPVLPYNPGTGSGTGSGSGSNGSTGSNGSSGSSGSSGTGATDAQVSAVASKVDPELVDINTVLGAENAEAAGTGIVISSDGVILTNNHVVAGATSITVTDIGNGKNYQAAVVGYDRTGDVAVLKLSNASGLATATLSTTAPKTGDSIVAIGNAGGTGGTPSAVGGVVSGLNKSITAQDESSGSSEQLTGLIEVNADIEAGDSGGPLLTTSGQVIGMDTAASSSFSYGQQQQASGGGDGYAIPIATATSLADQIRAGKSSSVIHIGSTAYLGIEVAASSQQSGSAATGPTVRGVVDGTPAASAGLAQGDVIQSVGGKSVADATALTNTLDGYHPGDKVKITWTDVDGTSHSSTVKLATGPVG